MGGLLFDGKDISIANAATPSRPVGGEEVVRRSSITPIEIKGGRLVYCAEIPCKNWDLERELQRKNGGIVKVYRKEFRVSEEMKGPIGRDWSLVLAHLPAANRRVAEAKFQARMVGRHGVKYGEDIASLAGHGDLAEFSDEDLVRQLGELDENVFETGRYWVASLPYGVQR